MSIMIRPDSGTSTRAANQRDVNKHINELQQELTRSRAETQRAKDKLSCLISLVRRSWNGDRNASIHLANIIGLDLPPSLSDSGTTGRPGTRMQTTDTGGHRAVLNWERMTVRLLQRDYDTMQSEIREYQQRYIENRSRYMDEVMHHHHQDMSRTPCSRPSSAKVSTVDQQFLQTYSMMRPDGKLAGRQPPQRVKSAVSRPRPKVTRDVVEQAEVRLRDLFVDSTAPASLPPTASAADAALGGTKEKQTVRNKRIHQPDYDDSTRYIQGNLFHADEVLTRKPRPLSAAVLRERDQQRARPRSAVTLSNIGADTTNGNRPLKYETTRPVSGKKPSSGKTRRTSSSSTSQLVPPVNRNTSNAANDDDVPEYPNISFTGEGISLEEEEEEDTMPEQPPISVRVKNAVTRPHSVDKFSNDLRHMEEMEMQFKKNTVALQKKLGLPDSGLV